jgi:hypothetical protein
VRGGCLCEVRDGCLCEVRDERCDVRGERWLFVLLILKELLFITV